MTYLLAFAAFMILILLMAIGVLMHRQSIKGSCGGLSSIGIERACDCVDVCEEHRKQLYQISEPDQSDKS